MLEDFLPPGPAEVTEPISVKGFRQFQNSDCCHLVSVNVYALLGAQYLFNLKVLPL